MPHDPQQAFVSDMTGIYAQHAQMWTVLVETIKLLVTVSALPILAVGVLLQHNQGPGVNLRLLLGTDVVVWTLLFTPVVAFAIACVIMQNRFAMLFYARGINKYRAIYAKWASDVGNPIDTHPMPVDPRYPSNYEPVGQMGMIIHVTGISHGIYFGFGIYGVFSSLWLSWVAGLAYCAILEAWYVLSSRRADWTGRTASLTLPSN